MQIHLGGHLSWYDPQKRNSLEVSLPQPIPLLELAYRLGLPAAEIAIVVVNGQAVELDQARVSDGDRVELYPPVGGG